MKAKINCGLNCFNPDTTPAGVCSPYRQGVEDCVELTFRAIKRQGGGGSRFRDVGKKNFLPCVKKLQNIAGADAKEDCKECLKGCARSRRN